MNVGSSWKVVARVLALAVVAISVIGGPVAWSVRLTVNMTGMNTATPTGTATAIEAPDQVFEVTVSK